MLQQLKTKEEASRKNAEMTAGGRGPETSTSSAPVKSSRPTQPQTYSRYDQEQFSKKEEGKQQAEDHNFFRSFTSATLLETSEFQIDTNLTFRGTTLKSITEGTKAKPQQVSGGQSTSSSNQENSRPQKRSKIKMTNVKSFVIRNT